MSKTFNIYCDESCHIEHDHKKFMFLGSVSSAYNQVKLHTEQIKQLKKNTISTQKLNGHLYQTLNYVFILI